MKGYKGREAVAAGEAFDPTPENVEARVVRGKIGEGIKTAVLEKKTRGGTVNLVLNLRFGNEDALKGKVEAAEFVGSMLMRGTKTKTRQQIDFAKPARARFVLIWITRLAPAEGAGFSARIAEAQLLGS